MPSTSSSIPRVPLPSSNDVPFHGDHRVFSWSREQNDRYRSTTTAGASNGGGSPAAEDSTGTECHACTQVGVPVFHSTRCDSANLQPEWEASAGSSLIPIHMRSGQKSNSARARVRGRLSGPFGPVVDPRSEWVQKLNQVVLLARGISLAIDPLFFYSLTLTMGKGGAPCLRVDYVMAAVVTVLRTCVDAFHLWHLWLQFRLAYVSRESLVVGSGKLVWDAGAIARHYVTSLRRFWLDAFVILPIPQTIFWFLVPIMLREEKLELTLAIMLLMFMVYSVPKIYHCFCLLSRMQSITGYVFSAVWWGFGLSLIGYLIASHIAGGCWYMLVTSRVVSCLKQQCERKGNCSISSSCSRGVCYQFMYPEDKFGNLCSINSKMIERPPCFDEDGPFEYGIYSKGLLVVSGNSLAVKIFYPIYWGLINFSTMGNVLAPTSNLIEVIFSILIVMVGLILFTLMIGNIQLFLSLVLSKNKMMQLKRREVEWWMRRRQLPSDLRRRVRHFERQRWVIFGGEDDLAWIEELPEGLRRDIKRYLCLDLIRKVPLFDDLDDLVLDNICDRVKPLIFSKGEKIIREGDPVPRMIFIMRGRVERSQNISKGMVSRSVLEPGGFLGDELLFWCLRRPYIDRLPASTATFVCTRSTEAFSLDAGNLRYITEHFRYSLANERQKRKMRYYSSNWRSWGAVNIQFAWRRSRTRTRGAAIPTTANDGVEGQLRRYAAMFMSLRPHDHLD